MKNMIEKEESKILEIKMKEKNEKEEKKFNKYIYEDIKEMNNYLKEGCNLFNDNFELVKFINSGSEGIFYEGKIKKINKKVGIKFILKQKKEEKNHNEIRLHNSLKNKNIVNLYGYFSLKDVSSCIIMEYGKYGDLKNFQRNLLRKKCLSETMLCYISKHILDRLKYCHNSKTIHMDIKPQNILVDECLNIKLTDFSVSLNYSKFTPGEELKLPFLGTTLYMAPEVIKGLKIKVEECNKIDIYSLGVLIYSLAFNKYPFNLCHDDCSNINKIFEKIKLKPLIFPDDTENTFSDCFKDFMKKILCNNIKGRLSIDEALNHPWIKGADILFDEKEKLFNLEKFVINLISDNYRKFNNYVNGV